MAKAFRAFLPARDAGEGGAKEVLKGALVRFRVTSPNWENGFDTLNPAVVGNGVAIGNKLIFGGCRHGHRNRGGDYAESDRGSDCACRIPFNSSPADKCLEPTKRLPGPSEHME